MRSLFVKLLPFVFSPACGLVLDPSNGLVSSDSATGPSSSSSTSSIIKHARTSSTVPSGFTRIDTPSNDATIDLRIGLKAADNTGLEQRLYAASTPGNTNYGKWLTREGIKTYAAPSEETRTTVISWLDSQGIPNATTINTIGAWDEYLSFSLPIAKANELLGAEYTNYTYSAKAGGNTAKTFTSESDSQIESWMLRTLSYTLPAELKEHITVVHPGISFIPPTAGNSKSKAKAIRASQSKSRANGTTTQQGRRAAESSFQHRATSANSAPESCATKVTPACLQDLYGIPAMGVGAPPAGTSVSNVLGVTGLHSEWAEETDLQAFLAEYRPDLPSNTTFTFVSVANGTNPQEQGDGGFEASLDIQYTVGLATGIAVDFISVGNILDSFFDTLLDLAEYLSTVEEPPTVVTTSYGITEGFLTEDDADLLQQVCNAFMPATARGISLLFSSGDDGAGGCTDSNNTQALFTAFPGSCPYVTAVGSVTGISPEVASNFSGGGFSNFFSRPSYQDAAVSSYLSSLASSSFPANQGLYNTTGRAVPDVSAQGENVPIITNGREAMEFGTSCSSPIFASLIAEVNQKLINEGKSVLGFLNPFIYSNPQAFFDIVHGSNPGDEPTQCETTGWPALEGWDPATGFGTPDFDAVAAAAGL